MSIEEKLSPDDPRLTAYALGEMEPAERAEFEQLLQQDAAARVLVAGLSGTAHRIGAALAGEPLPEAMPASVVRPTAGADRYPAGKKRGGAGQLLRFPQLYFTISSLAAACFVVAFLLWGPDRRKPEPVHYTQIDLSKIAPAKEPMEAAQKNSTILEVTLNPAKAEPTRPEVAVSLPKPEVAPVETVAVSLPVETLVPVATESKNEPQVAAVPATTTVVGDAAPRDFKAQQQLLVAANPVPAGQPVYGLIDTTGTGAEHIVGIYGSLARDGAINPNVYKNQVQDNRLVGAVSFSEGFLQSESRSRRDFDQGNSESYDRITDNAFLAVASAPLSTFSIDVDTAAYANVRRFLQGGQLPPPDAVRIEELVNYFPYRYAAPDAAEDWRGEGTPPPFAAHLEVAGAPWAPEHRLVRIGLKGREVSAAARPAANLVFLLDVSGSMNQPNKLPLVQESLRMLVDKLRPDDRVAIVVYAGASGLALPSTKIAQKQEILAAIDSLQAGGSTNGAMGIHLAYDIAKANFVKQGINRIVLCTDGDFNVGVTDRGDLTRLVEKKAKGGVFLSVLGFGMGNLKDAMLEQLADKGNGNYGYIDSRREAQKLLVEQAGGTLLTIAKDVKIQVEFNPAHVQAYRLIGYENRLLPKEQFNDDTIDAGEIGAGHTVTALYEVVPAGTEWKQDGGVDGLKYQTTESQGLKMAASGELLTVKLRYKAPDGDVSSKLEFPLRDGGRTFEQASADFKFAASVAAFGMILRDSPHKGSANFAHVCSWAQAGLVDDAGGYRSEFVGLVNQAARLGRN